MNIKYTKDCTTIYDSYLLKKDNDITDIIAEIITERITRNIPTIRTIRSLFNEIKAHNRLYRLDLFRSHTKDTDLEENIKWWKEIIYFILSI